MCHTNRLESQQFPVSKRSGNNFSTNQHRDGKLVGGLELPESRNLDLNIDPLVAKGAGAKKIDLLDYLRIQHMLDEDDLEISPILSSESSPEVANATIGAGANIEAKEDKLIEPFKLSDLGIDAAESKYKDIIAVTRNAVVKQTNPRFGEVAVKVHAEVTHVTLCEAAWLVTLRHPNIQFAHKIGLNGDHLEITQPLAVRDAAISCKCQITLISWIHQALLALDHLHQRKIIHGDVKPHNFLLMDAEFKLLRLTDMEFARRRLQPATYEAYTKDFRPPEIWEMMAKIRSPGWSTPADMWALGATIYFWITGRFLPLMIQDQRVDYVKQIDAWYPNLPNLLTLNEPLKSLVIALLQRQPEKRPTAAELLADPIFKNLSGTRTEGKLEIKERGLCRQRIRSLISKAHSDELVDLYAGFVTHSLFPIPDPEKFIMLGGIELLNEIAQLKEEI